MKKIFCMGVALTMALAFTSCKSSESAYKKAYEKAQQAQQNQQAPAETYNTPTTTSVEVAPVTTTPTTTTVQQQPVTDYSNVNVRTEKITLISGPALKPYSVVVGSFSVKANAEGLSKKLQSAGLTPSVVSAPVNGVAWYRVVAGSFDTKNAAASFRASQQGQYPDAWLLYSK